MSISWKFTQWCYSERKSSLITSPSLNQHLALYIFRTAIAVDALLMELDGFVRDALVHLNRDIRDKHLHQIALPALHGVTDVTLASAQVNFCHLI
jgi:hypothetical protein